MEEVDPLGPDRSQVAVRITFSLPVGVLGRLAGALAVQHRAEREAEEVLANLKVHLERGGPVDSFGAGGSRPGDRT